MRLVDIVTPDSLERAIHWQVPDDPGAARAQESAMKADQEDRYRSTLSLLEVFGKCLLQCGPMIDDASLPGQLELIHKMLISIDAAIDLATREVH